MAYYYVQPHTAFLYVLYVHCLIMDFFGTFALGYCNKRNLGGSKIIVTAGPALRAMGTWPLLPTECRRRSTLEALHVGGCSKAALHPMPTFPSRPLSNSPLHRRLKKHPALFGVPFLLVMVGASFGLQAFTQTRYDLHSQKVTQVRAHSI